MMLQRKQVEMVVVVDAGEPLEKATYGLNTAGPLAIEYEIISSAIEGEWVANYPNLEAIVR